MPSSNSSRGIQSLEIGLSVLRVLQNTDGAMSLKALASKTGLSPSKLHRYCISLSRAGFARQDARGTYRATTINEMSEESGRAKRLSALLLEMRTLVETSGHSAFVSEWTSAGPVIVHIEETLRSISVRPRREGPLPCLTSATGQVFLAYLDGKLCDAFLAREVGQLFPSSSISAGKAKIRQVQKILDVVRQERMACSRGDHIKGISSYAVPVTVAGKLEFVVTSYGISETFNTSSHSSILACSRSFAERFSD